MSHFDLQPQLQDDLIILRPLKENDFEELYLVASDPLIWQQHPEKNRFDREVFKKFFRNAMGSHGAFAVIDRKTGQMIGSTRFQPVAEVANAIEIGWTFLARSHWGGEYNRSMKELMINYALQFVDNILFYIGEGNVRSQLATEKLGAKRITQLDGVNLAPRPNSSVTYRISKST